MAAQLIFLMLMAITLIVIAAKSIAITKDGERLVVFRLGKFLHVCPPGLTLVVPFIDKGVKVRVDQIIGWQTLPESELERKIAEAVTRNSA